MENPRAASISNLPDARPDYFPAAGGRYEVKPGLVRFGKPLGGGGDVDGHVFQFDASFPRYRRAKLAARAERLAKYFQTSALSPDVRRRVCRFIVERLTTEHPALFQFGNDVLECALTGERLGFDSEMELKSIETTERIFPPYTCALDALAAQVQEDLAVVSASPRSHWLSAIHLCFPNAWAAEDKIGRTFALIHEPVAGIEAINRQSDALVETMLNATDGLVRFAWGVTWDDELNHHPQPPPRAKHATRFDAAAPQAFLRVERQTIWGFPGVSSALFTIRTYLYDCAGIRLAAARRDALVAALRSMSAESAAYKGIAESRDELLKWLDRGQ